MKRRVFNYALVTGVVVACLIGIGSSGMITACKPRVTSSKDLAGGAQDQSVIDEMEFLRARMSIQEAATNGLHSSDDEAYMTMRYIHDRFNVRTDQDGLMVKLAVLEFYINEVSLKKVRLFSKDMGTDFDPNDDFGDDIKAILGEMAATGDMAVEDVDLPNAGDALVVPPGSDKTFTTSPEMACYNFPQCNLILSKFTTFLESPPFQDLMGTRSDLLDAFKTQLGLFATAISYMDDTSKSILQFRLDSLVARANFFAGVVDSDDSKMAWRPGADTAGIRTGLRKVVTNAETTLMADNDPSSLRQPIVDALYIQYALLQPKLFPIAKILKGTVNDNADPNADPSTQIPPQYKNYATFAAVSTAQIKSALKAQLEMVSSEIASEHILNRSYLHYIDRISLRNPQNWYTSISQMPQAYNQAFLAGTLDASTERVNNTLAFHILTKFQFRELPLPYRKDFAAALDAIRQSSTTINPNFKATMDDTVGTVSAVVTMIDSKNKQIAEILGGAALLLTGSGTDAGIERELSQKFTDFTSTFDVLNKRIKIEVEAEQAVQQFKAIANTAAAKAGKMTDAESQSLAKQLAQAELGVKVAQTNKLREDLAINCLALGASPTPPASFKSSLNDNTGDVFRASCNFYTTLWDGQFKSDDLQGQVDLKKLCAIDPEKKDQNLDQFKINFGIASGANTSTNTCAANFKSNLETTGMLLFSTITMPGIGLAQSLVTLGGGFILKRAGLIAAKKVATSVVSEASSTAVATALTQGVSQTTTALISQGLLRRTANYVGKGVNYVGKGILYGTGGVARWYGRNLPGSLTFELLNRSFNTIAVGGEFYDSKVGFLKDFIFSTAWGGLVFGTIPNIHMGTKWLAKNTLTSINTNGLGAWLHVNRSPILKAFDFTALTGFFAADGWTRDYLQTTLMNKPPPPPGTDQTWAERMFHSAIITAGFQILTPFYGKAFRGLADRQLAKVNGTTFQETGKPGLTPEGIELWSGLRAQSQNMDHQIFMDQLAQVRQYKIDQVNLKKYIYDTGTLTGDDLVTHYFANPFAIFNLHPETLTPETIPSAISAARAKIDSRMDKIIANNQNQPAAVHAAEIKKLTQILADAISQSAKEPADSSAPQPTPPNNSPSDNSYLFPEIIPLILEEAPSS